METVDLDMNDVFGDGEGGDEDYGAAPVQLDDEDAPMQMEDVEATQGEGDDVLERLRDISKGAAKKRVMKPQPKLDAERLKGNRGLAVLPKLFADVKFKEDKGYEAANLKVMMGKLEHWAHRLFPKLPFDDFIERMEKLGQKKGVQNCVKRIRLDMPVLDEDYVQQYEEDGDENEAPQDPVTAVQDENKDDDMDAEEAFDEMIRQERELQQQKANTSSGMNGHSSDEEEAVAETRTSPKKVMTPPTTPSQEKKELSADVKERIERNKRLAMEKRMKRMGLTPNKTANLSHGDIIRSPSQESRNTSARLENSPVNEDVSATKSKGATDSPQDTELASGQLQMSESEPKQNSEADLNLQMTETDETRNADSSLGLKLSASQPGYSSEKTAETGEALDLHLTESVSDSHHPSQSSINLKLTGEPSELNKSNDGALNLHLTETENTDPPVANDVDGNRYSNSKCDSITDGQKVEGTSTSMSEEMSERKASEESNSDQLDLKLSLSDSETMPMDTSLEDSVIS